MSVRTRRDSTLRPPSCEADASTTRPPQQVLYIIIRPKVLSKVNFPDLLVNRVRKQNSFMPNVSYFMTFLWCDFLKDLRKPIVSCLKSILLLWENQYYPSNIYFLWASLRFEIFDFFNDFQWHTVCCRNPKISKISKVSKCAEKRCLMD